MLLYRPDWRRFFAGRTAMAGCTAEDGRRWQVHVSADSSRTYEYERPPARRAGLNLACDCVRPSLFLLPLPRPRPRPRRASRTHRCNCSQRKPKRRSLLEATTYSIIYHSRLLYLQEARSTILDRKCKETKASIKLSKRRLFTYVTGMTRQQCKSNVFYLIHLGRRPCY